MSPIPSPNTPPESNVRLESITLHPARPPLLRGIVHVRNIAFEKTIVARFTTDGWTTVSEAHARYVGPAPSDANWDVFAFTIPLEMPRACPRRTLLFAVRYSVPGSGDWWDNNGGADFRAVVAPPMLPRTAPRASSVPVPSPGCDVGGVSAATRPRRTPCAA